MLRTLVVAVAAALPLARTEPRPGDERVFEVADGVKMRFCWIPPGKMVLGSPKDEAVRGDGEDDRHFESKGFWLGKYEVTQHEWTKVMGSNPSVFAATNTEELYKALQKRVAGMDTSRFPVDSVSWDDICGEDGKGGAGTFLGKVNARPGARTAFGRAGKFVLPHEDEWEYAARGGHKDRRPFYWGTSLNGTEANVVGENPFGTEVKGAFLKRPTPVGSYEAKYRHPWGLCDMHGNVWEWCENKLGPVDGRIRRGGSWTNAGHECRAADRDWEEHDFRGFNYGFRLCFRPD